MIKIAVIVGSTRQGRFAEKAASWIVEQVEERCGAAPKILDLMDFPMPFFDAAIPPAAPGHPPYENPVVQRWTAAIADAEAFIFVAPEYNHSIPAVLKNAIDWVFPEWGRKPAAFVSYGGVLGARAVEHLRQIVNELHVAPMRSAVHMPTEALIAFRKGGDVDEALIPAEPRAHIMIDELMWWAEALNAARARDAKV